MDSFASSGVLPSSSIALVLLEMSCLSKLWTHFPPAGFLRDAKASQVCCEGLSFAGQMFAHVLNINSRNWCLFWSWGTLFSFTLFIDSEDLSI